LARREATGLGWPSGGLAALVEADPESARVLVEALEVEIAAIVIARAIEPIIPTALNFDLRLSSRPEA
jgi:hypothetical protein